MSKKAQLWSYYFFAWKPLEAFFFFSIANWKTHFLAWHSKLSMIWLQLTYLIQVPLPEWNISHSPHMLCTFQSPPTLSLTVGPRHGIPSPHSPSLLGSAILQISTHAASSKSPSQSSPPTQPSQNPISHLWTAVGLNLFCFYGKYPFMFRIVISVYETINTLWAGLMLESSLYFYILSPPSPIFKHTVLNSF